jgi:hypothetical protein
MLKAEDVIVLLKLASERKAWTVRSLEADTAIPRSVIHRSLGRLSEATLLDPAGRRVNLSQAEEFLIYSVKYLFPPLKEGETRGIPTAWAATPLKDELAPTSELPPVWPDPTGKTRGIALRPLHPAAKEIYRRDPGLAEQLALIDAIRLGNSRIRDLATTMLSQRLHGMAATR